MLSLSEAIYVLACRGMKAEHQMLLRAMLEARWKLKLSVKSVPDAEELALSGEYERVKMLENALKHRSLIDSDEKRSELSKLRISLVADNKAGGIRKLTIREIAERADSIWEYELTYALLCQPTHTDSRELQSAFELNPDGRIEGVLWGPDHTEAGFMLANTMSYLFEAITNPVVTMLPPDLPEAHELCAAINEHIVTQHRSSDERPEP